MDPFGKLEMVWCSLESWFNLILAEVEKTQAGAGGRGLAEKGTALLKKRMQSIEGSNMVTMATDTTQISDKSTPMSTVSVEERGGASNVAFQASDPVPAEERVQRREGRRRRVDLTLDISQSNHLAAAIVNSTPVERRVAYLRSATTALVSHHMAPSPYVVCVCPSLCVSCH